jgi:hypothetical protein
MTVYPNKLQPIQYINKTPYLVIATAPITQISNPSNIKGYLRCTTAFRSEKQNIYIFCNEIEEAEYEEI